jgi:hypothetical protein
MMQKFELKISWGCPVGKRFWTSFNIWLSSALDLEIFELTPKETVLGLFSDESSLQNFFSCGKKLYSLL